MSSSKEPVVGVIGLPCLPGLDIIVPVYAGFGIQWYPSEKMLAKHSHEVLCRKAHSKQCTEVLRAPVYPALKYTPEYNAFLKRLQWWTLIPLRYIKTTKKNHGNNSRSR